MFAWIIMFATSFFLLSVHSSHCGEQTWFFKSNLHWYVYFRNSYWDYLQKSCCKITESIEHSKANGRIIPKAEGNIPDSELVFHIAKLKRESLFS